MIYIYRKNASEGARQLADAFTINARRWRAVNTPIEQKVRPGDTVVCWGERLGTITGVRILNGAPIQGKYEDALKLATAGVPTIKVAKTVPQLPARPTTDPAIQLFTTVRGAAEDFLDLEPNGNLRTPVFTTALDDFLQNLDRLRVTLRNPIPTGGPGGPEPGWLGRSNHHVGGNDLLTPTTTPDYYSKKEELVKEYRIHSFQGRSLRAGIKDLRDGFTAQTASPWIRSWDGGWRIVYDGVTPKQKHRDIAHEAVKALGLDFGAVDIGEKADGSLLVLEVNRAPGLEGGTVTAYANAITKVVQGV